MVRIPSGSYQPLYAAGATARVVVAAFSLDRSAVTRGQYLAFVRANAAWRRSAVHRDAADAAYLADWTSDLAITGSADEPVTGVLWFAAKAFCAAQGKRLPTIHEWEYAAAADAHRRDASADPAFRAAVLAAYSSRHAPLARRNAANVYGVRGLHDRVWEWTLDFNPSAHAQMTMHEHHAYCASAAIGAADPSNYPAFMRQAVRAGLTTRSTLSGLGFRCAAA
jgi:formylglycine-generating enzyme required for sulfatase activity